MRWIARGSGPGYVYPRASDPVGEDWRHSPIAA
jgi:hypothetical protein